MCNANVQSRIKFVFRHKRSHRTGHSIYKTECDARRLAPFQVKLIDFAALTMLARWNKRKIEKKKPHKVRKRGDARIYIRPDERRDSSNEHLLLCVSVCVCVRALFGREFSTRASHNCYIEYSSPRHVAALVLSEPSWLGAP